MAEWGWRIPFIVGGLLGIYAFYLRRTLSETQAFHAVRAGESAERPSLVHDIWENRRAVVRVLGLIIGATVAYYVWSVSATSYAITVKNVDPQEAMWAAVVANLVFIAVLPVWGWLSDRWGRKPNVIIAMSGLIVLSFPLNGMIQEHAWQLGLAMSIAMIFMASYAAIVPALMAEQFPARVRATGFALPYSVAVAVAGGTAPYLMTLFASHGISHAFTIYTMVLLAITLLTALVMPETKAASLE